MPKFLEGNEFKIIQKRYVLFCGRHGVGKSHYLGCLVNEDAAGFSGLQDGTKETHSYSFEHNQYAITVIDTIGMTGIFEIDLQRFNELILTLQDADGARLSTIFFCVKWGRFTEVDKNAIRFLQEICSKEMHQSIHIIVTHTPKDYLQDQISIEELKKQFHFLLRRSENNRQKEEGEEEEEIFKKKFSFVDLLPPHTAARFEQVPEATAVVRQEWIQFRNQMLSIIEQSQTTTLARRLKKTTWIEDIWRIHRVKIIIAGLTIGCILLAVLYSMLQVTATKYKVERDDAKQQAQQIQEALNKELSNQGFLKGLRHVASGVASLFNPFK